MLILGAMLCLCCVEDTSAQSDQTSLHALFGADTLASNMNAVRSKAAGMTGNDRYEYLQKWVLPSETHPDFRARGEFTPTDPSPPAIDLEPYRYATDFGGELVSPVFDLLETAKALQRLDELERKVEQLPEPVSKDQLRARLIVQLLIDLEQAETSESRDARMTRLNTLTLESFKSGTGLNQPNLYWPELLLIERAMRGHSEFQLIGDLLGTIYAERVSINRSRVLHAHLQAIMSEFLEEIAAKTQGRRAEQLRLKNWIPVSQTLNLVRGDGYPQTRWTFNDDRQLTLASGKHEAYLVYRSPLTGRYEVVSEMGAVAICQVLVGGSYYGTHGDGKHLVSGTFREGGKLLEIDYPALQHDPTIRYRAVSDNNQVQVSINGRECVTYPHSQIPDPWIGVRSMPSIGSAYNNLVISGEPTIPDQVEMLSSESLSNWLPYYLLQEWAGFRGAGWSLVRDAQNRFQLQGRRRPGLSGSFCESALMYYRPLVEDGSVEYEFLYQPGRFDAHPVLDRLVFLVQPDGVRLHWLTDGKFDRTEVAPENSFSELSNQLTASPLPLRNNNWNRLKLEIAGAAVTLELNGTRIYRRPLEPSNHRTFGLFHYSDRTALNVRNVVMRGDWPKSVPPIEKQELADPALVELESGLQNLNSTFRHDFAKDGLPEKHFQLEGLQLDTGVTARQDGVHVRLNSVAEWTVAAIVAQFQLAGDFDIRARFEMKDLETGWREGGAFLETRLADDESHYFRTLRGHSPDVGHVVRSHVVGGPLDARRLKSDERETCLATSGCLRISRIGDRLYSSFAPYDSSVFRVLHVETITDADLQMNGIRLELSLHNEGSAHVVWKELSIKAEQMLGLDPDQKRTKKLSSMSRDGRNPRELTAPKFGLDHAGLPDDFRISGCDWPPDGKQIVFAALFDPTPVEWPLEENEAEHSKPREVN